MTQSNLRKKGFIWLIGPDHSLSLREDGAGIQAGTMEGNCLAVYYISYIAHAHI